MKAIVVIIFLLLAVALSKALTNDEISSYLREHPSENTYAQFRSLIMNGIVTWDASPTPGVIYRVYYGTTPGKPAQYRDVGAARTFSLPYWVTGSAYYVSVAAVKRNLTSTKTVELKMDRVQ